MAQEVPTYTMSVFKLPNALCDEMTSLVCKFWWGQANEKNKMTWLSWDKMCKLKEEGAFSFTLLAKQEWRLLTGTNSLVHRVFKARYFTNGDFLSAELGNHPSFVWRSIMVAQSIIRERHRWQRHRWQVGNGLSLYILKDKWLPLPSTF